MEQNNRLAGEHVLSNEEMIALLRKIQQGRLSALLDFYDATNPLVYGLVLKVLGEGSSSEEALLDIYTQVWKQSGTCDPAMPPLEWLTVLARRMAVARLHLTKRDAAWQSAAQNPDDSGTTVAPEFQKLARSSLLSLVPAQRDLLERAYFRGLSCDEMASRTGKPVGAVRTHIRAGLGKLRELLRQETSRGKENRTADGGIR